MNREDNCRPYRSLLPLSLLVLVPLLGLLAVASLWRGGEQAPPVALAPPPKVEDTLRSFPAKDADALARVLDGAWKAGKAPEAIPNIAPQMLPRGLERLDTGVKKTVFVRSVLPHVLHANRNILAEREMLLQLRERLLKGLKPRTAEAARLEEIARRYRIGDPLLALLSSHPLAVTDELLTRVDIIPPSLVLAQAAIESAWGASRFVIEGNNLFGQLIYTVEKGMVPAGLGAEATFALARFDSLAEAVESYAQNLNSLGAYKEFRKLRAEMRSRDGAVDSDRLAEGLTSYSSRGESYVEDVKGLIRVNRFKRFDAARLIDVGLESVKALLVASNAGV